MSHHAAAGRLGAYVSWSRTQDRSARLAPARAGLQARFEREAIELLGPNATDRQIADAAESLRKAFYQRLSASGRAAQAT